MAKKDVLKGRSIVSKNIFDTANQSIDEIKRANPIVSYFESKGVKLTKSGDEYKGLCPFHDDKNPSLSVNGVKEVFKCFGCGKAGTVLDACSYFENISIGEAVKLLGNKKQRSTDDTSTKLGTSLFPSLTSKEKADENPSDIDLKLDISDIEPPELPPEEKKEDEQPADFDLNKITEYYHKKLYENQKAVDYLHSRGLKNPEILKRFKIGFADGSLVNILSKKQKDSLIQVGILRENGQEHFKSCLIFPIFDDNDNTVGLYARNIDDKAKVKHLYLKGKHKGIFNRKASKVYDEIILTESIIDALSLIEIGFDNVQAVYGINGFTDEHLQTLRDDRVKTIIIGFDKDGAGIKASDELKDKLINENFKVKIISPPVKKDWNEELINGTDKETIKGLLDSAVIFEKKDTKKAFEVKKDGFGYIFSVGEINYSVSNVKDSFTHNLKVNIRTEYQGERFPDNVDLYSSRSRDNLSLKLSQRFGIEVKRIEKDLLSILDYLEDEQKKRLAPDDEEKQELTEEERQIGMEFLKNKDIFDRIVRDMEILGHVGEEANKKLMYLCATSRLMDDPLNILVVSQSATGKSYLIETTAKLMPPEAVVDGKTFSKQALQYMGDKLMDKFFVMGEAIHDPEVDYQLRELLSSHKLVRHTVFKDEKTGEMTTREIVVFAKMSSALTTTDYRINAENASRYFLINTDETMRQSVNIVEEHKNIYSEQKFYTKTEDIPAVIKKHFCAQRLLQKYVVIMPEKMRETISFPVFNLRCRRDSKRFFNLIASVCFLRQYQKEVKQFTNGVSYIECDAFDYEVAYDIMTGGVMSATFSELTPAVRELHAILKEVVSELAEENNLKFNEVTFTQKQVRTLKNVGQTWLKTNLKILIDYEYVEVVRGGTSRIKGFYRLKDDEELESIDLKKTLPSPETIKKAMETAN